MVTGNESMEEDRRPQPARTTNQGFVEVSRNRAEGHHSLPWGPKGYTARPSSFSTSSRVSAMTSACSWVKVSGGARRITLPRAERIMP